LNVWGTSSGRTRRWQRRRDFRVPVPLYVRLTVLTLSVTLGGTLAWHGARLALHPRGRSLGTPDRLPPGPASPDSAVLEWQRDALESIETGVREANKGNITAAEVAVDRAGSDIEEARVQAHAPTPDFFEVASAALDRVLQQQPENARLFEHATIARIDLAQLRSTVSGPSHLHASASTPDPSENKSTAGSSTAGSGSVGPVASERRSLVIAAPREIAANHALNPEALGSDSIDATLMPQTAEILLPPSTRLFVDNVRVENLRLEGASQTLDGIHWKNVTFVGTRLRYESGELDLRDVRFIRCTFGFTADERGSRLANAIALGQTSLVID